MSLHGFISAFHLAVACVALTMSRKSYGSCGLEFATTASQGKEATLIHHHIILIAVINALL